LVYHAAQGATLGGSEVIGRTDFLDREAVSRLCGRIALVAVFGLLAILATRQVSSLDVGFHLKAGEHILAGNGWPETRAGDTRSSST
jgi:hypothetical protein